MNQQNKTKTLDQQLIEYKEWCKTNNFHAGDAKTLQFYINNILGKDNETK